MRNGNLNDLQNRYVLGGGRYCPCVQLGMFVETEYCKEYVAKQT